MRQFTILLLSAIVLFSCGEKGFSVKGNVSDAADLSVYFDQVNPVSNTNNIVARSTTDAKGSFKIPIEATPAPGLYRIRIGAKSAYVILDGSESGLQLDGTLDDLSTYQYQISGSPASAEYASKMREVATGQMKAQGLASYVQNEAKPLIGLLIGMKIFGDVQYAPLHAELTKKISAAGIDPELTKEYKDYATALGREYQRQQAIAKVKVGEVAPEIALPGLDGKERKLSDLKGNVVLLDFWASWCGPCRRENPHVVSVYDQYKDQGFTVFSVSLDGLDSRSRKRYPADQLDNQMRSQKQRWVAAIEKDQLKWDHHVSDLKKWESVAAATYGVTSIPRTFLLDRDGRIAVINPRRNLESAVRNLL